MHPFLWTRLQIGGASFKRGFKESTKRPNSGKGEIGFPLFRVPFLLVKFYGFASGERSWQLSFLFYKNLLNPFQARKLFCGIGQRWNTSLGKETV
jgi:hypothetical protein